MGTRSPSPTPLLIFLLPFSSNLNAQPSSHSRLSTYGGFSRPIVCFTPLSFLNTTCLQGHSKEHFGVPIAVLLDKRTRCVPHLLVWFLIPVLYFVALCKCVLPVISPLIFHRQKYSSCYFSLQRSSFFCAYFQNSDLVNILFFL